MSRTNLHDWERAELMVPCDLCGAVAGAWCTTTSGENARYLHGARFWAVRDIVRLLGWAEMLDDCEKRLYATRAALRKLRTHYTERSNWPVVRQINEILEVA